MRTFLALFWPSGHDRQPKMRSNLTPSGPKQNPSCGTPCWTWSKSLGSTSIRVGPRQTRGVGTWRSVFGCECCFTVFMAFLTKFFSHRCLTSWNQTSKTGDFEVIRLCCPSLCTDSVALSYIERLYLSWRDTWYLPMPVRAIIYVLWLYVWEFSCGMVLRHFAACPWDYSNRQWNLCGLITLQYFPAWLVASVYQDFCCTIPSNTFQRHRPRQTERVLTSRKQEGEKRALLKLV